MCEIWDEVRNQDKIKGEIEGKYESIRNVMKNLNLNVYDAMKKIRIKKEQYETYVEFLELEN